jgi:hypothetical protein
MGPNGEFPRGSAETKCSECAHSKHPLRRRLFTGFKLPRAMRRRTVLWLVLILAGSAAHAGGGLFGIDHE